MASILIENISKSYSPGRRALDAVALEVERGELFGLIGPDGAGKTTLIRILITLLLADTGRAEVEGMDVVRDYRRIRSQVGYMPGRFSLYQDLSVRENLQFFATLFGTTIEANYDLIRDIYEQIAPFRDRKAGNLSGGMKQKLALSCALIHRPIALFLDEPTTGVDPVSRREFWEMLQRLREEGITIFVSTPYMDEASRCDRVALIQEGRLLTIDRPSGIVSGYRWPLLGLRSNRMHQLIRDLREYPNAHTAFPFGDYVHLAAKEPPETADLQKFLANRGHEAIEIKTISATIEDCFMDFMVSRK